MPFHENDYSEEVRVLNQLLAAQSVLPVFSDSGRLSEFIAEVIKSVPGVLSCNITIANEQKQFGDNIQVDLSVLSKIISSFKFEQYLPTGNDDDIQVVIPLRSAYNSFGLVIIKIGDNVAYKKYEPAVRNLVNICVLQIENQSQMKMLTKYREHLEELVEERTAELNYQIAQTSIKESAL
jgi:hypothetical protein